MKRMIYLDNAATTKTNPAVVEAMLPYFSEHYGNPSSIYEFSAESRNLKKNLKVCGQVRVFVATVGIGADQLIQRYERFRVSRAVVFQAMAAAVIEEYCDSLNRRWREEYEARGLYLRPRFSPGYGDFPLECQREILERLEAGKKIGLTLTDSLIMMPSKSVTAVIGVSRIPAGCAVEGCEACGRTDCEYRRN